MKELTFRGITNDAFVCAYLRKNEIQIVYEEETSGRLVRKDLWVFDTTENRQRIKEAFGFDLDILRHHTTANAKEADAKASIYRISHETTIWYTCPECKNMSAQILSGVLVEEDLNSFINCPHCFAVLEMKKG